MKRNSIIVAVCSALLLTACQKPTTYRPELSASEIRAEQIEQQRMVDAIKARGGAPKKRKTKVAMEKQFERVAKRIEKAGAEVCRDLGLPQRNVPCYYRFSIKEDEVLNAYADGKNVVVNTGMMNFLENDDELATILGHELAHNMMGHVEASGTNQMAGAFVGILIDSIAASQGVSTGGAFGSLGRSVGHLTYSVDFEEEADYVGLFIMSRAGYDADKAPDVWRRMSIESPNSIYNSTTHPSNAARYVALKKTIREIEYKRQKRLALLPEFQKIEE